MKTTNLGCLLAALCACATVPKASPQPAEAHAAAGVVRELELMSIGAMPKLKLGPLVFGVASMDYLVNGAVPAASGNVLCATSTTAATWQTPASCGLAALSGSTFTSTVSDSIASGSNAFAVTVNGARVDFGSGASDYASSDGTTVTFAGPVASASTVQGTALQLSSSLLAPVVTATSSGTTSNQQGIEVGTKALVSGAGSVTFSPAFTTSSPVCTCTDSTATAAVKCSETTTTLTIAGTTTDTIDWICIGRK